MAVLPASRKTAGSALVVLRVLQRSWREGDKACRLALAVDPRAAAKLGVLELVDLRATRLFTDRQADRQAGRQLPPQSSPHTVPNCSGCGPVEERGRAGAATHHRRKAAARHDVPRMYQPVQHLAAATRCATSIESNRSIESQCTAQRSVRRANETSAADSTTSCCSSVSMSS